MMDTRILNLIDSPNPEDRKKAVKLLTQNGSEEALRYLAVLYKSDNDAEVRNLAVQAGRYIKKQQLAAQGEYRPALEPKKYKAYRVSGVDQERSHNLMEAAMNLATAHKTDQALSNVKEAFKLNPDLQDDLYYMNMAIDIVGKSKAETLAILLEDENYDEAVAYDDFSESKRKFKNGSARSAGNHGEVTWNDVALDVGIFFLANLATTVVFNLMYRQMLSGYINVATDQYGQNLASAPEDIRHFVVAIQSLVATNVFDSFVYGLSDAVFAVIWLFAQYAIIHFFALIMFAGKATFVGLIHRATTFNMIWGILMVAFYRVSGMLPFQVQAVGVGLVPPLPTAGSEILALLIFLGLLIIPFGGLFRYIKIIHQYYKMTYRAGCIAIVVSLSSIFILSLIFSMGLNR